MKVSSHIGFIFRVFVVTSIYETWNITDREEQTRHLEFSTNTFDMRKN